MHSEDSDYDDDEIEDLFESAVNRRVEKTVSRTALPVQRTLDGHVLPNQQLFYEEIKAKTSFGRTHHILDETNLSTYVYPSNFEERDYQFEIVRKALFENVICAIPTGTGKTFIASAVMLNFFRWTKNAKIIFTAPTRPLVAQQIQACLGVTGIPYEDTAILLDKSRKNRVEIWNSKRVFFTTPQVIENDLKRGVLNPKDVVCLVIDEAHRARGAYSYVEVIKFMDRFNTSYRILALTATPGADLEGVQEVVNNLNISRIELRTENDIDLSRYMKNRELVELDVSLTPEIEDIIEQLGIAIMPVLKEAVELGIYDECHPSQINAFVAFQKSQKIVANPTIPEGVKWRNFFILQVLSHMGHMLKRLKIYGIRTFYSYFENRHKEFTTKFKIGKSTNKTAASFYYNPILNCIMKKCTQLLTETTFLSHNKLRHVSDELHEFFKNCRHDSRAIIFTELRESALEIVKFIDSIGQNDLNPHIFIGQARGKDGFDDEDYLLKHKPKGRKKADRIKRQQEGLKMERKKKESREEKRLERLASRTGSSEEAQISGMNQKQQKDILSKFKEGVYNVLVCTSIGEEGLDIGEVDLIISYDTTSSPIKNIQRMGRTGRKRDGRVVFLLSGNESTKFHQSMRDYAELQSIVKRNFIECQKSDRILPGNVSPTCERKFITVGERNEEVNDMTEADDVIKFATQAMLGKLSTKRRPARRTNKSEPKFEKRFFMPDNVETGIVKASSLVNKATVGGQPSAQLSDPEVQQEPAADDFRHPILDDITFTSPDISPGKSPEEEKKLLQSPTNLLDALTRHKPSLHFEPNDLSSERKEFSSESADLSLKRPLDSCTSFELSDDLQSSRGNAPVKKFRHDNDATANVPRSKALDSTRLYKKHFKKTDGLLSSQEKRYFERHYFACSGVSIEPIPSITQHHRMSTIHHSSRTAALIEIFEAMDQNTKQAIQNISNIKGIAAKIGPLGSSADGSIGPSVVLVSDWNKSEVAQNLPNKPASAGGWHEHLHQNAPVSQYKPADPELFQLLDSDLSDF
ncbi:LAMI_0E05930g1_1 [Lachancea mirantina]|uniref:ATP-dependent DNA helicase n=1 Tax=Lachancea mirantina TaxID=1230905 RepID=A0A1G4JLF8_9SACH|nr:LAMI_0E05930g1_1 [Lachancea mirantina]